MRAHASKLRSVLLAWCLAPPVLILATGLRAAEPGGVLPFSGELHSSKGIPCTAGGVCQLRRWPAYLQQGRRQALSIDLPASMCCTVFVDEREWETMPLVVEDVNVNMPLPLPELARELLELGRDDQALRGEYAQPNDPDALERLRVEDEAAIGVPTAILTKLRPGA